MFKTFDMILIGAMVAAAAVTYQTKHSTETTIREIRKVEQQIRFEQETIDVLNADWALLTQPSRMQTMADSFEGQLELKPLEPGQIAEIDKLPARPVLPVVPDEGLREAMEATGRDMTATGSVKP